MKPTLLPGDYVLSTSLFRNIVKNNIIIFIDEYCYFVIKRVISCNNKNLMLGNDNKNSSSVFCDKPLKETQVSYKVLIVIRTVIIDSIFKKIKKKLLCFTSFFKS